MLILETLPSQYAEILKDINNVQIDGPSAIAELVILCIHLAAQADNPHFNYAGPSGEKPLEYLQALMKWLKKKSTPKFLSFYSSSTQEFSKPQLPQQKTKAVKNSVAKQRVEAALHKAHESGYPHPRHHSQCCEALVNLWQKGVPKSELQPLIDAVLDANYFKDDHYGHYMMQAIKALMYIGEWDKAIEIIEPVPICKTVGYEHRITGIKLRVAGTKWLIETGRPDLARVMLDNLMKQQDQFPTVPLSHIDIMFPIADAWARLGETAIARNIKPLAYPYWYLTDSIDLECTIVLTQYNVNGIADPNPLLGLLDKTPSLEPPKSRATTQLQIFEILHIIGEHDAAWKTLDYLQATLLETPLWGKREHRTEDVIQAIFPYIDSHTDHIYSFATGLLINTAKDIKAANEFWNIVFVVSGLKRLIWYWAGAEGIERIAHFLDYWQKNPQLTTQDQRQ